jgi:hypothetical protein
LVRFGEAEEGRYGEVGFDKAVLLRCDKVLRGQVGSGEVRTGSHGGVRSGMVVNGEDKAGLLRRGRERSGCVRFYAVRYGRFAEARSGGDRR